MLHLFTPRYSWNIARVGTKHQSINHGTCYFCGSKFYLNISNLLNHWFSIHNLDLHFNILYKKCIRNRIRVIVMIPPLLIMIPAPLFPPYSNDLRIHYNTLLLSSLRNSTTVTCMNSRIYIPCCYHLWETPLPSRVRMLEYIYLVVIISEKLLYRHM